jgi:alpha-galactosidase
MTDTKITFIGAGSGNFAMNVVKDICLTAGLHGSTVTLMDLDENRLDAVYTLARWYSEGKKAGIRFEKTLDRKGALDGADFVIDTALAGGHDQQEATRAVGERHGYYRGPEAAEFNMVADYSTTFQGYYQLKLFMDLARDMEEVCPDAWLRLF